MSEDLRKDIWGIQGGHHVEPRIQGEAEESQPGCDSTANNENPHKSSTPRQRVKGMLFAPLSTAGVSDEVGQELQMPMGPQMLEDVEEPMPARPATL